MVGLLGLLCGLSLSLLLLFLPYGANIHSNFLNCAVTAGLFFYCHEIIYFDSKMKLFMVMASFLIVTGALTGGVIGALLPKISSGLSIGFLSGIMLSLVLLVIGIISIHSQATYISTTFIICLASSLYLAQKFEELAAEIRTSLTVGFVFTISMDITLFKGGFLNAIFSLIIMELDVSNMCISECYLVYLVNMLILISMIVFFYRSYRSGSLSTFIGNFTKSRYRNYNLVPNHVVPTEATTTNKISEKQRTFSYPDTLEFNYFDPDNLPEELESYADSIFTIVQSLSKLYGFQVDNSRNQAEHLLMLLFNETHITDKLISGPAYRIHCKMFANYRLWCDRMGAYNLLMKDMSLTKYEILIEDILVYLLIWGEAANLRHMPECLCYLFHKTMLEHISYKSKRNGKNSFQTQVRYPGYFLDMVITPIYDVMAEALAKSSDHAEKKTYDDFNEFFWSPVCLRYRIHDQGFINGAINDLDQIEEGGGSSQRSNTNTINENENVEVSVALKQASKTYLEKRSWLHPLYSMHRIFEWHAITFTLLSILAFSDSLQWTYAYSFQVGSFVFLQISFFGILWTCLEVWTVFPSVNISSPSIFGYLIRLLVGYLVFIYQTIYFHWSFVVKTDNALPAAATALFKQGDSIFWWWQFVWLSLFTSTLYIVESFICWFPSITSNLMSWNNDIVQACLNICYPFSQLYVGKNLHVTQKEVFLYIFFWITLIAFKFWFGYKFVVFPVTVPTLELYDDYMNYEQVPFFKTATLIYFWWFPHFLVYLIDLSIWYAVWSSIVGGGIAIIERQGAVRECKSFRSHFMRAPLAFVQKLMPSTSLVAQKSAATHASTASLTNIAMLSKPNHNVSSTKSNSASIIPKQKSLTKASVRAKSSADLLSLDFNNEKDVPVKEIESEKDLSGNLSLNVTEFLDIRSQRWVVFAQVWNEIIKKLRQIDHISDAEEEIFLFTYFDWLSKPTYLPLYQTAGCLGYSAIAFKESSVDYIQENDSQKKMLIVESFYKNLSASDQEAIHESWELAAWIFKYLLGSQHIKDVDRLISVLANWSFSRDIFSRVAGSNITNIIIHLSNIVQALKKCAPKRKKTPVVTPEYLIKYNQVQSKSKDPFNGHEVTKETNAKIMKKSVSTGFLSALSEIPVEKNGSQENVPKIDRPQKTDKKDAAKKSFVKLQPFRKSVDLEDNVRDKIRDEMRSLLSALRNAMKIKSGISAEGQDMIDRVTFILSLETGFIWNDVFASRQIDDFVLDSRSIGALNKLDNLLNLRITQVELKSREAKRRLNFFMNSLFMDMPSVPSSRFSKEFTVMTPYYTEDILISKGDLESKNSDGVSTLLYLQTLYKDDWNNFLERRKIDDEQLIWTSKHLQELRCWASLRAQTLYRTVEGMMHSEAAVRLFAELEHLKNKEVDFLAKMKFNYVVACQVYGSMKSSHDSKADDIDYLLEKYPNLRVAYIDSMRVNRSGDIAYYSVLVKHEPASTSNSMKKCVKEVYRIKLPGNPVLGEGKPENQNHAIIFTRGRYLQAMDMNQDGYFEESLKMRNLLEEFDSGCVILGFREHIFTGSVSSVANYMALQELSFVTLGQRVLNIPLRIRQHYGHPDLFNKIFVMTAGGMSKASKGINLSEDVFSGFNATIRGQTVSFREYVQVGKGRDVGLQQTYKFEAKLSQGNAEQSLSRDLSRICDRLDFFRLLSFYYGGIGHYMANTMVMFTLVVVVYTMLALAIYGEEGVNNRPMHPEGVLQLLLSGMGLLQTLPLAVTLTVEKGFQQAISEIGYMFLSGGPLYFIFHIETKCYYFSQTLLAGGAKYRPTGRGFVTRHSSFDENFRFFAASHIYLGFELMVALILFAIYTKSTQYFGLTWSLWLTVASFLLGPFWFNPLSFEWNKISEDYEMWIGWMMEIGGTSEQSWDAWWRDENGFYHSLSPTWKLLLIIQKCFLWIFIAKGLVGNRFLTDPGEQGRFLEVIGLVVIFIMGNWIIGKLERYLSYAVRRMASLIISTTVLALTIYLFATHPQYFRYTVAIYYFLCSISFSCLVLGAHNHVYFIYKLHDYIVGHVIFLLLSVFAFFQMGYFQTWLLYYDALSAGVEMKDILKYARRSKERATDETELINELKIQVARQERTIKDILEKAAIEMTEKSSLQYRGGSFGYGSVGVSSNVTGVIPDKISHKDNNNIKPETKKVVISEEKNTQSISPSLPVQFPAGRRPTVNIDTNNLVHKSLEKEKEKESVMSDLPNITIDFGSVYKEQAAYPVIEVLKTNSTNNFNNPDDKDKYKLTNKVIAESPARDTLPPMDLSTAVSPPIGKTSSSSTGVSVSDEVTPVSRINSNNNNNNSNINLFASSLSPPPPTSGSNSKPTTPVPAADFVFSQPTKFPSRN